MLKVVVGGIADCGEGGTIEDGTPIATRPVTNVPTSSENTKRVPVESGKNALPMSLSSRSQMLDGCNYTQLK